MPGLDDNVVVPYSDTVRIKDTLSIPKRCSTAIRLIDIFVHTICEDQNYCKASNETDDCASSVFLAIQSRFLETLVLIS